ncbi:hypothetical protein [Microseira wollei]|uniref:Uncharacterized protein n=1 Tax=Microseira wollei NIES-4236 TaxID=2530354 RepID=A0AAV3WFF9_9CYAN|nr:hypothetical protein [Microseira wollei]GET36549.1 hypothetical protein MiSe_13000 [Microseira wollei NIES-4236]
MLFQLLISNTSNYPRTGHVAADWKPIYEKIKQHGLSLEEIVLHDLRDPPDIQLPRQVDLDNRTDPSRDTLLFSLNQEIPPGQDSSIFVAVDRGKPIICDESEPCLEVMWSPRNRVSGIRLMNSRLIVWLNLIPAPESKDRSFYAGASTSVQRDGKEMLDPFLAELTWIGHDPEKRCMQVDQIQLYDPASEKILGEPIHLFDQPYQFVSHSIGPVRTTVTIASIPFGCNYPDPTTNRYIHLTCKLYRAISLYTEADYLIEKLFIEGISDEGTVINPYFVPRYYAHINLRHDEQIYQYSMSNWSAVGSPIDPRPGYGFASNVPHESLKYGEHGFLWQLSPCDSAECLHLFMCSSSDGFDSRINNNWDEYIYRPLRAAIYEEGQDVKSVKKVTPVGV